MSDIATQLRDALTAQAVRVIDLFREWDEDGDGTVSKKEFRKALPALGLKVPREEADALFDEWDKDGDGSMTMEEMNKQLRRGNEIQLDAKLAPGASGRIELSSSNKHTINKGGPLGRQTTMRKVNLSASSDKPIQEQLRDALVKQGVKVITLFREWDEDGDGTVSKKEFRKAMPLLGLDVPRADIDALFDSWDPDGSGKLAMKEVEKQLRRGSEIQLDAKMQAGAAGKIETKSANKHGSRKGMLKEGSRGTSMRNVNLSAASDKPIQEQLRDALAKQGVKVINLFREWDEDQDGTVSKKEFRKAMPMLGLDVPKAEIDKLFDSWDPDGSGTIEMKELERALRRGAEIQLDAKMQAGAAGKIELSAKNKISSAGSHKGLVKQKTVLRQITLDESSDKPISAQLRDALTKQGVKVISLFREWDEDGDGTVSKKEFRKAMPLLGLNAPKKDIDALFDEWDPDGSGSLAMKELEKQLRRGGEIELDAAMQAGARGAIETSAKNKSTAVKDGTHGRGASAKGAKAAGKGPAVVPSKPPSSARSNSNPSPRGGGGTKASPSEPSPSGRASRGKLDSPRAASATTRETPGRRRAESARAASSPREQRPDTAPPPAGGGAPLSGWGTGDTDAGGPQPQPPQPQPQPPAQPSEGLQRPPSRSNLSSASHSSRNVPSRRQLQRLDEAMPGPYTISKAPPPVQRAAQIYLAGSYGTSATMMAKKAGGVSPRPASAAANASSPAPSPRQPQPPTERRARSPPRRGERGGGANEPGRGALLGSKLGSKHELESALSSAQTALVMAKERVMALEASNDSLKVQLGERAVSVTKQKLQEAQQMLEEKLLTADDFAAIKQKYMQENFGVSADK